MANLQNATETAKHSYIYQDVANLIHSIAGYENLYFVDSIAINNCYIYAACASPYGDIYLCSDFSSDLWHKLEETDINYCNIITSLYNKVQSEKEKHAIKEVVL